MSINGWTWYVCASLCLCAASTEADERADGLKRGEQLLRELKPLTEGHPETDYYELVKDGEAVGFTIVSLEAVKEEQRLVHRYSNESGITISEQTKLLGSMNVTLTPRFSPIRIEIEHTMIEAPGFILTNEEELLVGEKTISISKKSRGPKVSREVPTPQGPFVFAVTSLLQRVDFAKYPSFSLRRLDPANGQTTDLHFSVKTKPDGSREVSSTTDDGKEALRVVMSPDGTVSSWTLAPSPYVEKRTTKERVEELKARLAKP